MVGDETTPAAASATTSDTLNTGGGDTSQNNPPNPSPAESTTGAGGHDPLGDNPKQREYAKATGNVSERIQDIPEPTIRRATGPTEVPEFEKEAQQQQSGAGGGAGGGGGAGTGTGTGSPQPDNRFENVRDLPPGQKRKSAKALAELLVKSYAKYVPMLFRKWATFSECKLMEIAAEGKVDFNMEFFNPNTGKTLKLYQIIQEANNQVDVAFEVTHEWQMEILPYVIEELKNRNWGTTPMQTILWMVAEDLGTKTVGVFAIKSQLSALLNFAMEQTAARGGTTPHQAAPPQPATEQPAPTAEQPAPQEQGQPTETGGGAATSPETGTGTDNPAPAPSETKDDVIEVVAEVVPHEEVDVPIE